VSHQIKIQSNAGDAKITEHGGHLLTWKTADGQDQLYLSPRAVMDGTAAIRGGVPLCFPQFNMRVIDGVKLPKHGFARNMAWALVEQGSEHARFELTSSEATRAMWPHEFAAGLVVQLGENSLRVSFDVRNTGRSAFAFAIALHTYLAVSDIHQAVLHGLEGVAYWDAVADLQRPEARKRDDAPLRFGAETDRVYANAPRVLKLADARRQLRITHSDSLPDTVVWNPAEALCAQLADMPPEGWRQMLCVEAACIEQPVSLQPGERWQGSQLLELL
jgi:glucose-6-phosphate 1-epimerase